MNSLTHGPFAYTPVNLRTSRARSLAGLFAAGAGVSSVVVLSVMLFDVQDWQLSNPQGIALTIACAAGAAIYLHLNAHNVGDNTCHVLTAAGSVLIAACQVFAGAGAPAAAYSLLYVWVVLHSALFFSSRVVTLHIVFATAVHTAALWILGVPATSLPQVALAVGTQVAAALVIGSLASKLRNLAETDPLTGLDNRRVAERELLAGVERAQRRGSSLTLAVVDLDDFKDYNDRHGHLGGDKLLVELGAAWKSQLRGTDVIARTGGDEFTLILDDTGPNTANLILKRMLRATPQQVSCSIGVASWQPGDAAVDLVQRADDALYQAKRTGEVVVRMPVAPASSADR